MNNGLQWEEKYSVHVKEIDEQHKEMFVVIGKLIEVLHTTPDEKVINEIVSSILEYKKKHFATEEKYFEQFHYEGAAEHILAHKNFGIKLQEIQARHQGDTVAFAFALVDYLEDWLIGHLINMDQKYVKCFIENGLH